MPDANTAMRVVDGGVIYRDRTCPTAGGCASCPDYEHCRAVRIVAGLTSEAMENGAAASERIDRP